MALEDSPELFFERFAEAAFEAEVLPAPVGHPLLTLALPGGLLFAFDRGAPPAPHGRVTLLLHGVARHHAPEEGPPTAKRLSGGGYFLRGEVTRAFGEGFYLLESLAPILVYAEAPLELGQQIAVELAPPLMGFRP